MITLSLTMTLVQWARFVNPPNSAGIVGVRQANCFWTSRPPMTANAAPVRPSEPSDEIGFRIGTSSILTARLSADDWIERLTVFRVRRRTVTY